MISSEPLVSGLNQLLSKGDIVLVFDPYLIRKMVILDFKVKHLMSANKVNVVSKRYTKMNSIIVERNTPNVWNGELQRYEKGAAVVSSRKVCIGSLNTVLKIDGHSQLYLYGFNNEVIEMLIQEQQKVLDGFYDKKPKKKKNGK